MQKIQSKATLWGDISIDSGRIRIPLEDENGNPQIQLSDDFWDMWERVERNLSTGEELSLSEPKPKVIRADLNEYSKIEAQVKSEFIDGSQKQRQTLNILVYAKMLGAQYFEGITKDNSRQLYEQVMQAGLFSCDYDVWLNADALDIDLKQDFRLSQNAREFLSQFNQIRYSLKQATKATTQRERGVTQHDDKRGGGLEWSDRDRCSPSNPHMKLYDKGLELTRDKNQALLQLLNPMDVLGRIRFEVNIKNRKHWKHLGYNSGVTLGQLLEFNQERLQKIFHSIVACHMGEVSQKREREGISPEDQTWLFFLEEALQHSPIESVLSRLSMLYEDRRRKHHWVTKIQSLYTLHIEGTESDNSSPVLGDILGFLGLMDFGAEPTY